jgi:hypothetical protein
MEEDTKFSDKQSRNDKKKKEGFISGIGKKISQFGSKIANNKYVKILGSDAVSRVLSIGMAVGAITLGALALSGVSIGAAAGFILAPEITIPLAAASIGTIVVAAAIDTAVVGYTRNLHKENKYLTRHCISKDMQDKILAQNPKLNKALAGKLYSSKREEKSSIKNRYLNDSSKKKSLFLSIALNGVKVLGKRVISIVEGIITHNPIAILKSVAFGAINLHSETSHRISMEEKRNEFKANIDELRNRSDSPGYNNLKELKISARTQKIQTLALQELVKDPSYKFYSNNQIRRKFSSIKQKIENVEKAIQSEYAIVNLTKNFIKAHNPFSKYNNPNELTTEPKNTELKLNEQKSELKKVEKKFIDKKIIKTSRNIFQDKKIKGVKVLPSNFQFKQKMDKPKGRY